MVAVASPAVAVVPQLGKRERMILMIKKWILMVGLIVVVIIPAINLIINAGHIDGCNWRDGLADDQRIGNCSNYIFRANTSG